MSFADNDPRAGSPDHRPIAPHHRRVDDEPEASNEPADAYELADDPAAKTPDDAAPTPSEPVAPGGVAPPPPPASGSQPTPPPGAPTPVVATPVAPGQAAVVRPVTGAARIWILPLLGLIPILNVILLRGWRADLIRQMGRRRPDYWPRPIHIGWFALDGLVLWAASLLYALPHLALILIHLAEIIHAADKVNSGREDPTYLLMTFGWVLLVSTIYHLISWPMFRVAMIKYAVGGNVWAFINIPGNLLTVLRFPHWLIALFFITLGLHLAAAVVSFVLGLIPFIGGILAIIAIPPAYYLASGYAYGTLAERMYRRRIGDDGRVMPTRLGAVAAWGGLAAACVLLGTLTAGMIMLNQDAQTHRSIVGARIIDPGVGVLFSAGPETAGVRHAVTLEVLPHPDQPRPEGDLIEPAGVAPGASLATPEPADWPIVGDLGAALLQDRSVIEPRLPSETPDPVDIRQLASWPDIRFVRRLEGGVPRSTLSWPAWLSLVVVAAPTALLLPLVVIGFTSLFKTGQVGPARRRIGWVASAAGMLVLATLGLTVLGLAGATAATFALEDDYPPMLGDDDAAVTDPSPLEGERGIDPLTDTGPASENRPPPAPPEPGSP